MIVKKVVHSYNTMVWTCSELFPHCSFCMPPYIAQHQHILLFGRTRTLNSQCAAGRKGMRLAMKWQPKKMLKTYRHSEKIRDKYGWDLDPKCRRMTVKRQKFN